MRRRPPNPGAGGGQTSSAVSVQLFTSNANPKAGTCTLIEAVVTLQRQPRSRRDERRTSRPISAPSAQNGLGSGLRRHDRRHGAVTALCGPGAGTAKVKASATVAGQDELGAALRSPSSPDSGTLPFVSFCSPSFGPKDGGTRSRRSTAAVSSARRARRAWSFTVNGVSKDGVVHGGDGHADHGRRRPGFPEVAAPSAQAPITLILGTNQPTPVTLSLPTCFVFGTRGHRARRPSRRCCRPRARTRATRASRSSGRASRRPAVSRSSSDRSRPRSCRSPSTRSSCSRRRPSAPGAGNLNQTRPGHRQEHHFGRRLERDRHLQRTRRRSRSRRVQRQRRPLAVPSRR